MSLVRGRRTAAVLAGGALVAGTFATLAPAPAAQAETGDPAVDAAVSWLDAQLGEDDLFTYPDPYDDFQPTTDVSTTIDAGLSIAEVGGDQAVLDRIVSGLQAVQDDFLGESAGRYGKLAHFYQEAGVDATALVDWLEEAIDDETGLVGSETKASAYAHPFIVRALDRAASSDTAVATSALVDAQCPDAGWGYWSGGDCFAGVDATAWALVTLVEQAGDPQVDAAVASGLTWLLSQQNEDGSFEGYAGPDSNATGLAATALSVAGDDAAATAAADWVRGRQLTGATCDLEAAGDGGAIAYTDTSLTDAVEFGIGDASGEWILATAQAFPALQLATPAAGSLAVTGPQFARPGAKVNVTVDGIAPGARACATLGSASADFVGTDVSQAALLTLPKASRRYPATLRVAGETATTQIHALGKKRLGLRYKKNVKRGAKQVVTVGRLAPGEKVAVKVGKKVVRGKANRQGRFVVRVKMTRKGLKGIKVRGHYADRKAAGKFRVR